MSKQLMIYLQRLLSDASKLLPRYYRPDCCIAATRVLFEVLRLKHIRARPLPVTVRVVNPNKDYCVDLGFPDEPSLPGRWADHLVILVKDSIVLDPTLVQASRPEQDIHLSPLMFETTEAFIQSLEQRRGVVNGSNVIYTVVPDSIGYQGARDWWDRERSRPLVRLLLES